MCKGKERKAFTTSYIPISNCAVLWKVENMPTPPRNCANHGLAAKHAFLSVTNSYKLSVNNSHSPRNGCITAVRWFFSYRSPQRAKCSPECVKQSLELTISTSSSYILCAASPQMDIIKNQASQNSRVFFTFIVRNILNQNINELLLGDKWEDVANNRTGKKAMYVCMNHA